MEPIRLTQYGKWLPADTQTPISLYLNMVGDAPGILLESAEVDGRLGRYSLIAWDFRLLLHPVNGVMKVECLDSELEHFTKLDGMDYPGGLRAAMRALEITQEVSGEPLPPITRGLFGFLGYGFAGMMERKLKEVLPAKDATACMALPGKVVLFDHLRHSCCLLGYSPDPKPMKAERIPESKRTAAVEPLVTPGRAEYMAGVSKARDLIAEGECIQTVLSTRFSAPLPEHPFRIYRKLRQANPSPFMFYMQFPESVEDGMTLLGSSPELMVRCQGGKLEVRPIAGTRKRGKNAQEDAALAQDLLADPKERAEHVMLVDLGRNDLGRIATPGSVSVDNFMQVERFSHVMHLTSYVSAQLQPGLDALDVLGSTFPAGTLSGAPKIRAMEIIADIEKQPRGPYGGCIGWIGLDNDAVHLDTGITIRSMWVKDGMVNWQAGAGVVFDSDPEKEWEECNNKARIIREVLAGSEEGDVFAD